MLPRSGQYRRLRIDVATAIVGLVMGFASAVAAQPTVRIRAETRIELDSEQAAHGVTVTGVLLDDLGSPLAGQEVLLRATSTDEAATVLGRARVTTDARGAFRAELPSDGKPFALDATYEGDTLHDRMQVAIEHDARHRKLTLDVRVADGGKLDLASPFHGLSVRAITQADPSNIAVLVEDELGRPLAGSHTDARGTATFHLPSATLGSPGAGRLRVRATETENTTAALTEVPVVRYRHTSLVLAQRAPQDKGATPMLVGKLVDTAGPLPGRAVGIFADGAHMNTVLTDESGAFAVPVPKALANGVRRRFVAAYESDAPGWSNAKSLAVHAAFGRTPFPRAVWFALPVCVALLLLLLLRRREPGHGTSKTVELAGTRGAVLGPTSLLRAVRTVHGRLVDADSNEAIAQARLRFVHEDGTDESANFPRDERGGFASGVLRPGVYQLTIDADRYASTAVAITVPHRGEWSPFIIRMESLRSRWLRPFRELARGRLTRSEQWRVWTNREVAQALVTQVQVNTDVPLAQVVVALDRGYYGAETPTAEDAEDLAKAVSDLGPTLPSRVDAPGTRR